MSFPDLFTVACISLDIALADKDTNLYKLNNLLPRVPDGTDLLILPELFSTGFVQDIDKAKELAETEDGDTIANLKQIAASRKIAICGSFLSNTAHLLFNRAFFIEPDGETAFYDKRHLFCISNESKICHRGIATSPVIRYRRLNISMAVCYDIRFPAWLRNTGNKYDLLIVPANWPDKRKYAWEHLLEARAIENMSYVIGVNRTGKDSSGEYNDSTYIFDYKGQSIGSTQQNITVASLSKSRLETFREHFPVWKDADEFDIRYY